MSKTLPFRKWLLGSWWTVAIWLLAAGPLRSAETPGVKEAPAVKEAPEGTPAPVALSLDPNDTPEIPVVLRVARFVGQPKQPISDTEANSAARDDDIYVEVQMLDDWIASVKEEVASHKTAVADLVLYLNGSPLKGLHPDEAFQYREVLNATVHKKVEWSSRPVSYLRFHLEVTPESKTVWQQLLRRPDFNPRLLEVSVGFDDGKVMQTYVSPNSRQPFYIVTLPLGRFWGALAVLVFWVVIFLVLARTTDIIRDTGALVRPDERRPYSLGRTQMAFWFFLVLTSFVFLYVLTGETDTLNASVLGLLGISVGTALGGAFVDAGADPSHRDKAGYRLPDVDLSRPDAEILQQIDALITQAAARHQAAEAARKTVGADDQAAKDQNEADIQAAAKELTTLQRQREYFLWPAWRGVFYDLLIDNGFISFHRFQILVWTLVLGLMFVIGVYSETAMPEFNATLLGLLGISGGTYIGFKLPEAREDPAKKKKGATSSS